MTDWRDRAACLGVDDDTFFPDRNDTTGAETALRVCATPEQRAHMETP